MGYHIAVVGATGAVGRTMVRILEERNFPVDRLTLLASQRSAGEHITFHGEPHEVQVTQPSAFDGVSIALFSAGAGPSKEIAPQAVKYGTVVIDNSSAYRMDPNVPLVVPEVNPHAAKQHQGIIANPNCSTIGMLVALKPLHDAATIKRVVVSTYQAVSGSGHEAVTEMEKQVIDPNSKPEVYPHPIAFNILPHIGDFQDDGYTSEEWKMHNETRKILEDDHIVVTATTVRVPVHTSHAEAVNIETKKKLTPQQAKDILKNAPGVVLQDDPKNNVYPLSLDVAGTDEVYVGRVREDFTIENGLNLWVVSDNLRKGAATNAVQIAELFV